MRKNVSNAVICIVGNKTDLEDQRVVDAMVRLLCFSLTFEGGTKLCKE